MKAGEANEAEAKKREVESFNEAADAAEESFNKVLHTFSAPNVFLTDTARVRTPYRRKDCFDCPRETSEGRGLLYDRFGSSRPFLLRA